MRRLRYNDKPIAGSVCLFSTALEVLFAERDDVRAHSSAIALLRDELVRFARAGEEDLDFRMTGGVTDRPMANVWEERSSYILSVGVRAQAAWFIRKVGSVIGRGGPSRDLQLDSLART